MTKEVYLKKNELGRFDCYDVSTKEYIKTLTCGCKFILLPDDEDSPVPGLIEHHNTNGYFFTDGDASIEFLHNGLRGLI